MSYTNARGRGQRNQFRGDTADSPRVVTYFEPQIDVNENNITSLRTSFQISDVLTLETESDYLHNGGFRFLNGDFQPPNTQFVTSDRRSQVYEQDIRLRFDTDAVSGVIGVFYTDIDDVRTNNNIFIFGPTRISIPVVFDLRTENYALYGGSICARTDGCPDCLSPWVRATMSKSLHPP